MKLIVTGGAGFIGSAAVRHFVAQPRTSVINVDKLTYAASMESLVNIAEAPNYTFERADICDRQAMARIFQRHRPDAIMHLAAETHVDRSIDGAGGFVTTNIHGTHVLLEVAQDYWSQLEGAARTEFRFHHVSTDEVFGTLGASGTFTEASAYAPSSPYAASKAASDHLVHAWHRTYGLPTLISNCSNNYGSHQFPEKLIPLTIVNALEGRRLPVYGRGHNVRDWLYVDDHVDALERVLRRGTPGERYNIGGCTERRNIDVVKAICALLDELRPDERRRPRCELIELVADRPGHDFRYALAIDKISRELGWRPRASFESGLRRTVAWYLDNPLWWQRIRSGLYGGERLGTGELGSVAYA